MVCHHTTCENPNIKQQCLDTDWLGQVVSEKLQESRRWLSIKYNFYFQISAGQVLELKETRLLPHLFGVLCWYLDYKEMTKPEQERVRTLLTETVTLLCKNGLQFKKQLKVQGLLGITLDEKDVFVVHINEIFGDLIDGSAAVTDNVDSPSPVSSGSPSLKRPHGSSRQIDLTDSGPGRVRGPPRGPGMRPMAVSPGRSPHPSQSRHMHSARSASTSSAEGDGKVNVKTEPGLESSAMDDKEAMKMTYANLSISDIQEGFLELPAGADIDTALDGDGPPSKRRAPSAAGDAGMDTGSDSSQGAMQYQRIEMMPGVMPGPTDDPGGLPHPPQGPDDMVCIDTIHKSSWELACCKYKHGPGGRHSDKNGQKYKAVSSHVPGARLLISWQSRRCMTSVACSMLCILVQVVHTEDLTVRNGEHHKWCNHCPLMVYTRHSVLGYAKGFSHSFMISFSLIILCLVPFLWCFPLHSNGLLELVIAVTCPWFTKQKSDNYKLWVFSLKPWRKKKKENKFP